MSETIQPRQLLSLIWARIWTEKARQHIELVSEQRKRLEFADICPEWSKRLGRSDTNDDDVHRLISTRYCVVGEAHGFPENGSMDYHYKMCKTFALHDFVWAYYFPERRANTIESFVNHWNKCHVM